MKPLFFLLFTVNLCVFADSRYLESRNVKVKQEGRNSLEAKQAALRRANRLAFSKALNMELKTIESVSDGEIQDCIYDYSIEREKFSASVYIGEFFYRFYKSRISSLLKSHGIHMDFQNEENNIVKLAVYWKDFIRRSNELNKLKVIVEKFSDKKVVFNINRKYIGDFRKLRMKYAQIL
ncbi:MAG: hypothetical protein LBC04_03685 [Holosporaceae bacterium]|jgi:hypothetical protein|nr:hypothetical protein [Holosporaceae bacterium]